MKTNTILNTLLKEVQKVKLFAVVDNKQVETNLFGIYSPSVNKILIDCKGKFVPTTNNEFIQAVEEISNKLNVTLSELFSLNDGGKMCAVMTFDNVYEHFTIPAKLKRNINKVNLTAKLWIIEPNDTSAKLQVGIQLFINGESAFLINDNSTISSFRSSSSFSVRKAELINLINNATQRTNEFISVLEQLYAMPTNSELESNLIKEIFTKAENTSEKMIAMMSEVESNSLINKNIFGDNGLSVAVALGYFLLNKHDLDIVKNLENYWFSTLKVKNDFIIDKLKNIVKK